MSFIFPKWYTSSFLILYNLSLLFFIFLIKVLDFCFCNSIVKKPTFSFFGRKKKGQSLFTKRYWASSIPIEEASLSFSFREMQLGKAQKQLIKIMKQRNRYDIITTRSILDFFLAPKYIMIYYLYPQIWFQTFQPRPLLKKNVHQNYHLVGIFIFILRFDIDIRQTFFLGSFSSSSSSFILFFFSTFSSTALPSPSPDKKKKGRHMIQQALFNMAKVQKPRYLHLYLYVQPFQYIIPFRAARLCPDLNTYQLLLTIK